MSVLKITNASVGKKIIMAVTGLALVGFIIAHLLGNLTIFLGPDALNGYAKKLASLGPLLWVARISLIGIVLAHILTAIKLTQENRAARPDDYRFKKVIQTTYAARTMPMSGLIILAFIVFHLLHFTFKVTHPEISHFKLASGYHDVYRMVVLSFQKIEIVLIYVIAQILLAMHLSHGLSSLVQSLGLSNSSFRGKLEVAAKVSCVIIFAAYISIPLSCYFGIVKV
jgi:succinate dehydrogenase / fumarate reductase cytochrome b subunit